MTKLFLLLGLCLVAVTSIDCALADGLLALTTPLQREIERHIDTQKRIVGNVINLDPDTNFTSLFPTISDFNASAIIQCYNSSIGEIKFDFFKNSIFDAIKIYYKQFPENFVLSKFPDKVRNFYKSLREIATHTTQCLLDPTDYQLGITQFTDFSDTEYKELLGADSGESMISKFTERPVKSRSGRNESTVGGNDTRETPTDTEERPTETVSIVSNETVSKVSTTTMAPQVSTNAPSTSSTTRSGLLNKITSGLVRQRRQQVVVDPICFPKNKSPLPDRFNWRSQGKVTPARYQGSCGSCWAFASLAALESAYLIKGKTNNKKFDLSEQHLLACARKQGCKGGTSVDAFNYILNNDGVTDEKSIPYDFKRNKCDGRGKRKFATVEDYCLRGVYAKVNGKPENLSDEQIMQVIREFGPVYATINADHVAVKHLKSGVYNNPKCSKVTNHAITIIGWTKNAFIIKNSWGRKWGDDGFFRMKRGHNLCGLNTYITFPIL